ncbi:MAG: ABC transporter permease [Clostridiaceae bacterium]|nr:ABC transporter permease [Clostridiaceae bacterium]
MIKNEFIKFFRPSIIIVYLVIIMMLTGMFGIIINENYIGNYNLEDLKIFFKMINSNIIYYILPLFIIFFSYSVFTKDIYEGKLKFFMISGENRIRLFLAKVCMLLLITLVFVIVINILSAVMTAILSGNFNNLFSYFNIEYIVKLTILLIPILMVAIFISCVSQNSIIISIALFFVLIAFNEFNKTVGEYTITGVVREYLYNGEFRLLAVIIPAIVLAIINIFMFNRRDMVE